MHRNLCMLYSRFWDFLNLSRNALTAPSRSVPVWLSCSNMSRVASPIESKNNDRCCALSVMLYAFKWLFLNRSAYLTKRVLSWCTGSQGNNHSSFFVQESLVSCCVLFRPLKRLLWTGTRGQSHRTSAITLWVSCLGPSGCRTPKTACIRCWPPFCSLFLWHPRRQFSVERFNVNVFPLYNRHSIHYIDISPCMHTLLSTSYGGITYAYIACIYYLITYMGHTVTPLQYPQD